jgi:hypothetical protein
MKPETQPKHTLKVEPDWLQFEVMTGGGET